MSEKDLHSDDELNQKAPFLFGIKKEEPFEAPSGYFEKFTSELQDRIHSEKSTWWRFLLKPIVWAPAMVILIVSGIFLMREDGNQDTPPKVAASHANSLEDLSFEVLDEYVNENLLAEAKTDELVELVGMDEIPALGTTSEYSNSKNETEIAPTIQHIEEDEMEEYILENMDEIEVY